MAENKNRIIVYRDWMSTFESLQDDEAGRLIKHFFRYVNDLNPGAPDRITGLLFEPIKQTLKRDLKKYEAICLQNRDNINIRWNKNDTTEYDRIRPDTKHTDRDRDRDRDKDKDKKINNKKRKPQNVFIAPSLEEVEIYFGDNGYSIEAADKAYNYYAIADWHDSKGNKIRNWKQKMQAVWFKDDNKIKPDKKRVDGYA